MKTKTNNTKLSAWIREHKEYDRQEPEITPENFNSIRENLPNYTPAQKQLLLLRKIERDTKYPGEEIFINPSFDYPVAWASCTEEFAFYLKALICKELITSTCPLDRLAQIPLYGISLTIRGWEYLKEYSLIPAFLDQVFIAMSFSPMLKNIYDDASRKE